MIPTFILQTWVIGLLSAGILAGAIYSGHEWVKRSWRYDPALEQSFFSPDLAFNEVTGLLALSAFLFLITIGGRFVVKAIIGTILGKSEGRDAGLESDVPDSVMRLHAPDGSELQVKFYGPEDAQPIILSHGWGLNSDEWNYLKRDLAREFRLIVWDEPGLGRSARIPDKEYSLKNLACDLNAVLRLASKDRPAILLGHSIGGMIILTFCRLFPECLGKHVSGLILTHTTPTNPVRTTNGAAILSAIEKPVLVPLLLLTIAFSPLIWLANWLSYLNGSAHLATKRTGFGGTETWEQLEFATRFQVKASPAVLSRGMLAMLRYDAKAALGSIKIPVLVVSGDEDPVTVPQASRDIQEGIPGARLMTLKPARHLGLIEHHLQYAGAVRDFAELAGRQMMAVVV